MPTIKGNPAPVDKASTPAGRTIHQVGIVNHENIPLGNPSFSGIKADGNRLVHDTGPPHFQRGCQVGAIVHFIPFTGNHRKGYQSRKEKRDAFHRR